MNLLSDILTYIRRIIKSPSNASITDNLLIDYVNRFWISDVDARLQLFDLKTKYQFQTTPGVDQYNMPLYSVQSETPGNPASPDISYYPVYQGFLGPVYVNGIQIPFQTQKESFFNLYPNVVQFGSVLGCGNGTNGPYTLRFPFAPNNFDPFFPNNLPPLSFPCNLSQYILRGHVDMKGIIDYANDTGDLQDPIFDTTIDTNIATTSIIPAVYFTTSDAYGNNNIVCDSGQFLNDGTNNHPHFGLLMQQGNAPYGNLPLSGGYYNAGAITDIILGSPTVLNVNNTLVPGQYVTIQDVVGTVELNGNNYLVLSASPTAISIDVDSTLFTSYVSGGVAYSLQNVVNYQHGYAKEVFFPANVPQGVNIKGQCYYFQCGIPRALLYYNNIITLRAPPDTQYLIELDAYLSPAAFFNQAQAIPFAYMAEYIARGAARKILSDTGDIEQFQFYEPLFKEQELLVWKRSQRIFTSTRTETIYSQGMNQGQNAFNNYGGSSL